MTVTLDTIFPGNEAVLLDGAMGTALRERGWDRRLASVLANLDAPEDVLAIHRAHRQAGARVLTTNTFSALMVGEQRSAEAVRTGVGLARSAAAGQALVAGCVAAFGLSVGDPQLEVTVRLLVEEGVDLLVFETCNTLGDARAALQLKAALAPRLPVVICASSTDGGHDDRKRVTAILTAVRRLDDASVEVGLNCCRGPHDALVLSLATSPPVRWVKPSIGVADDRVDDNIMAAFARAARMRGARFVGACCGSSAATLSAMGSAMGSADQQAFRA